MRQFDGARRNMDVARPLHKFAQHAKRFVQVTKGMFGQDLLPFALRAFELAAETVGVTAEPSPT